MFRPIRPIRPRSPHVGQPLSLPPQPVYLGRFRHGDEVRHTFTPAPPDSVPFASVSAWPSGASVATVPVVPVAPSGADHRFRVTPVAPSYPVGRFLVSVEYTAGGVVKFLYLSFDVVPGGDSAGAVNTLAVIDRPEGSYLLAQVGSGRLLQGNNPKVPTT